MLKTPPEIGARVTFRTKVGGKLQTISGFVCSNAKFETASRASIAAGFVIAVIADDDQLHEEVHSSLLSASETDARSR